MKMRNKQNGMIIEVLPGAILPAFLYEPVNDKKIAEEAPEKTVKETAAPKKATKKKTSKKSKKGDK